MGGHYRRNYFYGASAMKTIQGQQQAIATRKRRIARMKLVFYTGAFGALLGFIGGAYYGWGDLILEGLK